MSAQHLALSDSALWVALPWAALAVLLALALLSAYQFVASWREARRYRAEGTAFQVGRSRLWLHERGEAHDDAPTVVLAAGLGHVAAVWGLVQPQLAATSRVCAYDRAGYGWSGRGYGPRTSGQIADELHALLHGASLAGPYILVGHSFGGLTMLEYALRYTDEVAGLVLVDALPPQLSVRDPGSFRFFVVWNRLHCSVLALATFLGITRLALALFGERVGPHWIEALPPGQRPEAQAAMLQRTYATAAAETLALPASVASLLERTSSGLTLHLPLVVLSHTRPDLFVGRMSPREVEQAERIWQEAQAALLRLSDESRLVAVPHAGHKIHLEAPEAVVAAVAQVIVRLQVARPVEASGAPVPPSAQGARPDDPTRLW